MKLESADIITEASGNQIISLPPELRVNDSKVYIKKTGDVLYIIPFHKPWNSLFESLNEFSADFMEDREQPMNQERELFD